MWCLVVGIDFIIHQSIQPLKVWNSSFGTRNTTFLAFGPTINDTISTHSHNWKSQQSLYLGQPMSFDNYTTDSHLESTTSKIIFINV